AGGLMDGLNGDGSFYGLTTGNLFSDGWSALENAELASQIAHNVDDWNSSVTSELQISIMDVIDPNFASVDGIRGMSLSEAADITQAMATIAATEDGRTAIANAVEMYGPISIIAMDEETFAQTTGYISPAYATFATETINSHIIVDIEALSQKAYETTTGTYYGLTLERAIVHELNHLALASTDEDTVIAATNSIMASNFGETPRLDHDLYDINDVTVFGSDISDGETETYQGEFYYAPLDATADKEYIVLANYDTYQMNVFSTLIQGGAGNDYIGENYTVNAGSKIYGYGGDDYISAGAMDDRVEGGAGDDTILGGSGHDALLGDGGNDRIEGGAGNDWIIGGTGSDMLFGQGGNDKIEGSDGKDFLFGGNGDDTLYGGNHNDYLDGEKGEDVLYGGAGTDFMYGGGGADTLYGQDDDDVMYGDQGKDALYGGLGDDELYGNDDNDILYGQNGKDTLLGGEGNDKLYGGNHNDGLRGGNGDDKLYGENGNDWLYGDAGADMLRGGAGNDVLRGGDDADTLWGNDGADTFVFSSTEKGGSNADTIKDFDISEGDRINIENVLTGFGGNDDINDFIKFVSKGDGLYTLRVDENGDGSGWSTYGQVYSDASLTNEQSLYDSGIIYLSETMGA
ncbi:MAG: calcium-binding protein, partial [Pseudomonadota bacterium]|nr:calcium-binding protein [Pseudomonadota bacterium]